MNKENHFDCQENSLWLYTQSTDSPLLGHQMSRQEKISNSLRNNMELHIIEITVIKISSKMIPFSTSLYRWFLFVTKGLFSRSSVSWHLKKGFNIKIYFLGVCPGQKTLWKYPHIHQSIFKAQKRANKNLVPLKLKFRLLFNVPAVRSEILQR